MVPNENNESLWLQVTSWVMRYYWEGQKKKMEANKLCRSFKFVSMSFPFRKTLFTGSVYFYYLYRVPVRFRYRDFHAWMSYLWEEGRIEYGRGWGAEWLLYFCFYNHWEIGECMKNFINTFICIPIGYYMYYIYLICS